MTVDERIERLTDRHEALAQFAELLGHRIEAVSDNIDRLSEVVAENGRELMRVSGNVDKLGVKIDVIVESVRDLVRVADARGAHFAAGRAALRM